MVLAIRLVFVAGIVAVAAAFAAWGFGGLTPLQALVFYVASGWIIILGGALGYALVNGLDGHGPAQQRRPRSIVVEVSVASGR